MTWQYHWEFWQEQVDLPQALQRAEKAEAEVGHASWELTKAQNRLQRTQERLAMRGRLSWRDIRKLKTLAGVSQADIDAELSSAT